VGAFRLRAGVGEKSKLDPYLVRQPHAFPLRTFQGVRNFSAFRKIRKVGGGALGLSLAWVKEIALPPYFSWAGGILALRGNHRVAFRMRSGGRRAPRLRKFRPSEIFRIATSLSDRAACCAPELSALRAPGRRLVWLRRWRLRWRLTRATTPKRRGIIHAVLALELRTGRAKQRLI
jgi:hypothetical protein